MIPWEGIVVTAILLYTKPYISFKDFVCYLVNIPPPRRSDPSHLSYWQRLKALIPFLRHSILLSTRCNVSKPLPQGGKDGLRNWQVQQGKPSGLTDYTPTASRVPILPKGIRLKSAALEAPTANILCHTEPSLWRLDMRSILQYRHPWKQSLHLWRGLEKNRDYSAKGML